MEKSKGHLLFADSFEYFERGGNVKRAPLSNAIMPDGYRSGRWVCGISRWADFKAIYGL